MPTIANISSKLVLDIGEFRTNASAADRQTARLTARMEKQAAAVGLTRNEAKLQQLAQRGATEEQLKAARAAQARVRAAEASAAADRRAAQLTDRARTSSERYAAEVADLRDLQRSGRITAQTYARSLDRLAEEHGQGRRAVLRHLTAQQRLNGALRRTPDLARASGRSVTIAAGATAVAAIAAGAAISRLYRGRAEDIDAAAKLADSIGINTRELQGLRLAAELTGAGSDAMDKSLARLQRSVGEAARGTGTARLAFAELGLDVEKLARLSVDDQFRAIADAFAAVESRTTRTTLAYQIFGRQGTALVNTLALGSAGLNETTAEAAKLGIAFDRIDAAKIEAANDASTRAATAVTGLANTLAIELAPIVAASADRFTAWAGAGEGAASSIVGAVDRVAVKIAGIVDAFQLPIAGFRQLVSIGLRGIANVVRAIRDIDAAMSYIVSLIPGVEIAASGMLDDLTEQLTDAADDAQDQARRAYRAWEQGANTRAVTQSLRQIRKEAQTTAEAVAAAAQAKGPAPTVADPDAGGAADAVTKQLDQLDAKLRAATADPITLQLEGLEAAGATADQLARARQTLDAIDGAQVTDQLDQLDAKLRAVTADPITLQLEGLEAAGATADQLARARQTLEAIDGATAQGNVAKQIEQLERRAADSGKDQSQRTLDGLQAAGATADQLQRAAEALAAAETLDDKDKPSEKAGPNEAIRAGSAQAQLAAFRAAAEARTGADQPQADPVQTAQLAESRRTNELLQRLDRRSQTNQARRGETSTAPAITVVEL